MNPVQNSLILGVRLYRWWLAPMLCAAFGPACRFAPSCSAYALEALQRHGAARGAGLALRRVARCHPWGGCGCDPVPARTPGTAERAGHN